MIQGKHFRKIAENAIKPSRVGQAKNIIKNWLEEYVPEEDQVIQYSNSFQSTPEGLSWHIGGTPLSFFQYGSDNHRDFERSGKSPAEDLVEALDTAGFEFFEGDEDGVFYID